MEPRASIADPRIGLVGRDRLVHFVPPRELLAFWLWLAIPGWTALYKDAAAAEFADRPRRREI